jgi:hypothetical protein
LDADIQGLTLWLRPEEERKKRGATAHSRKLKIWVVKNLREFCQNKIWELILS